MYYVTDTNSGKIMFISRYFRNAARYLCMLRGGMRYKIERSKR